MHSALFLLSWASLTALSHASPLARRDDDPSPWQVTALSTFSPSGRPGSSPYSTMNITITDPNTIDAGDTPTGEAVFPSSTAKCSTQWAAATGATPYGIVNPCTSDSEYSTWTFEVLQANDSSGYSSPTEDFLVRFTLVDSVTIPGGRVTKTFVGTGHFAIGDNMSGVCGGSGVCSWGLKADSTPVLVEQEEEDGDDAGES